MKYRHTRNVVEKIERKKPDYIKKCICLNNGYVHIVKKIGLYLYKLREGIIDLDTFQYEMDLLKENLDENYYEECLKIIKADYQRRKRLKERITSMLNVGQCLFITLTFTDNVLENTQEHIRRKYVAKFLKANSTCYVANIDYGDSTEREHYHAVILCDYLAFDLWPYGFSYVESITRYASNEKLAVYISKLTNHAIKESAKRCSLIYSRN